jgi:hypothetical protein
MKKTIIDVIKELKPREAVNGKDFPEFKKGMQNVLDICFSIYQAREKGTATKEAESKAMSEVTEFLHTLGKVNGKYISVMESTTEKGISSVLFDTLVYNSFKDRIFTKSEALAEADNEKAKASKKVRENHEKFLNGKGTAKDYKEAVAKYNEAVAKVAKLRNENGNEDTLTEKESLAKFTKFTTARLKAIIENRFALSPEEAEAMQKLRNKEKADKKKEAKKPEAKPEAPKNNGKKPENKNGSKATKPEAVKEATTKSPEAVKKTA